MLSAHYHGPGPNYKHGIRPLSPHKRGGGCPKLSTRQRVRFRRRTSLAGSTRAKASRHPGHLHWSHARGPLRLGPTGAENGPRARWLVGLVEWTSRREFGFCRARRTSRSVLGPPGAGRLLGYFLVGKQRATPGAAGQEKCEARPAVRDRRPQAVAQAPPLGPAGGGAARLR